MSEAQTETAKKPRAPRAPRGEFTAGDILNLERMGALEAATLKHGSNPAFVAACKAAGRKSAAAATLGGSGEGIKTADFRKGIFVSVAGLGGVEGSAVQVTRVGETMVVSLA